MTDGTQGSPSASGIAEQFILEGDGAPVASENPSPAKTVNEGKTVEGQGGQATAVTQTTEKPGANSGTTPEDLSRAEPDKAAEDIQQAKKSKRDRIQQLTRELKAAQAFAITTFNHAKALEAKIGKLPAPAEADTPDQKLQKQVNRAVTQERFNIVADEQRKAVERAAELAKQAWQEHTAEARAKYADFDQVTSNPDVTITPLMADTMREDEYGPEVAYYLCKNPAEAERIASLSAAGQVRALEKLGEQLAEAAKPAKPVVTKAPPPPQTVSGNSGASSPDLESMSFEEYRRARGFK